MADPISQFDNDFEQLEHREADDIISSTSEVDDLSEGLHADVRQVSATSIQEPEPLISFGEEPAAPVQEPEPAVVPVVPAPAPSVPVQSAVEEIGGESTESCHCCCSFANMDPRVKDLLLWTDVKKSGAVFVSSLSVLLSFAMFSIISVVAYTALIALTITVTFRLYKTVMGAVQKSTEAHPFKNYLEFDVKLNDESVHRYADMAVKHGQKVVHNLRHYVLIEDMVDSLKFALLLWVLTYIGSWFNGMTLVILADVALFSLPKIYQMHKDQIDRHVSLACSKIHETYGMVQEKIPFLGKKKQE